MPFTGKYSIQPNGLGTMTVTLGVPGNPHFDLSIAISSTGNGRLILNNESNSYPPNAWGTGNVSVQNPADLSLAANRRRTLPRDSRELDPSLNRYAGVGQYQIMHATGRVTTYSAYYNDNGNHMGTASPRRGALDTLDPTPGRGPAVANQ